MELDEEVVFGLGGLQLEREQAEAEAAAKEEEEEEDDVEMELPLPPTPTPITLSTKKGTLATAQAIPPPPPMPPKTLLRQSEEIPLSLQQGGVPLWEGSKHSGPALLMTPLARGEEFSYHPVVLDEWEDRIIWDPPSDDERYVFLVTKSFFTCLHYQ